jgi:hypothetical protein
MRDIAGSNHRLFFGNRMRSNSTAQNRKQAAGYGSVESANGLQARWNGQGDQALVWRLHGRG